MHIPDGFLNAPTWITMSTLSVVGVGVALRHSKAELQDRDVPTLGMMGAFIFAAQMVNFPIAIGTSGHLIGGALATAALGPWAANIVMTAAVIVQALFFRDGGITALGANVFNMALIGPWLAYGVYRLCQSTTPRRQALTAFAAGWITTMAAAVAVSLQLALSGVAPLRILMPTVLAIHTLIGLAEGAITAATLLYLKRAGLPLFRHGLAIGSRWQSPQEKKEALR